MAKAESAGDEPLALSNNELKFIKALFDNMTQKPDANWDAVATTLSLKDAKCAKERWRQLSVRHGWREGAGSGNASPSPRKKADSTAGKVGKTTTPRTPREKKAAPEPEPEAEVKEEDKKEQSEECYESPF
ncbi:uncharacterized protein J7T54_003765 [Emericellopsis cladophorae]|uniref:Myb-like domain-containing protein n=1 Tax=Emericellopsis cladophorae TaxID=2686198 RepID=A0A9Q0BCK0_9HYPO|nr:uncharacterized protein J7T54_003765 [Emericellopsis cladophorae]KAI6779841.1 hypothetical protein J7T54_003765 [Emericellopsis cladophorae]